MSDAFRAMIAMFSLPLCSNYLVPTLLSLGFLLWMTLKRTDGKIIYYENEILYSIKYRMGIIIYDVFKIKPKKKDLSSQYSCDLLSFLTKTVFATLALMLTNWSFPQPQSLGDAQAIYTALSLFTLYFSCNALKRSAGGEELACGADRYPLLNASHRQTVLGGHCAAR